VNGCEQRGWSMVTGTELRVIATRTDNVGVDKYITVAEVYLTSWLTCNASQAARM
jgi:hypothetical protein